MKRTRRNILSNATKLTALLAGASTIAGAQEYPPWDSHTYYEVGDRVTHDGAVWEAAHDSLNAEPSEAGHWWELVDDPGDPGDPDEVTASFDVTATAVEQAEIIEFDATDSAGDIETYEWDFGDGNSATGVTTSHAYDSSDEYTVTLTVTGTEDTDSDSTTITVTDEPDPPEDPDYPAWDPETVYVGGDRVVHDGFIWEANWWTRGDEPGTSEWGPWEQIEAHEPGPSAAIDVTDSRPDPGQEISFDGSGSDGDIVSYEWNLGDGTTAQGEVVSHAYDEDGTFSVELTVTAEDEQTDSTSRSVTVGDVEPPESEGIYSPYMGTWFDIVDDTLSRSTDRVVMSFIGDATRDGEITPGWLANCDAGCEQEPLDEYADEIQTLQDNGIEVGLSIGGWESPVVARDAENPTELKEVYADLLDTFGVTHLDIDDENAQDAGRSDDLYEIRNEALAMLKAERPEVTVGFTVSSSEDGPSDSGHSPSMIWIDDAAERGLDLDYVQLMTMHWSPDPTIETLTSAVDGTADFLAGAYPEKSEAEIDSMIGLTPRYVELSTDVATELVDLVEDRGLYSIAPWVLPEDEGGQLSDIFHQIEDD